MHVCVCVNFIDVIDLYIDLNVPPGTHNVSAPAARSTCQAWTCAVGNALAELFSAFGTLLALLISREWNCAATPTAGSSEYKQEADTGCFNKGKTCCSLRKHRRLLAETFVIHDSWLAAFPEKPRGGGWLPFSDEGWENNSWQTNRTTRFNLYQPKSESPQWRDGWSASSGASPASHKLRSWMCFFETGHFKFADVQHFFFFSSK